MGKGTDTLDKVSAALVAQGVGQITAIGTDWFICQGFSQDGPGIADRQIVINETPGMPALNRWAIDYPSIQVMARGKVDDYAALREKMQDVFYVLHEQETLLGSEFVFMESKQSAPILMGQDEKRRPRMAWNFKSMRNRPSDGPPWILAGGIWNDSGIWIDSASWED